MISRVTRINKSKYCKAFFNEHKTVSNQTSEAVRSLINTNIQSNKQIVSLNINNEIEPKPKTIIEVFSTFFSIIAKHVDNKITPTNKTLRGYLNASVVNSFFITFINGKEVESLIKEMNTSKSVGLTVYPRSYSVPLVNLLKR